MNSLYSGLVAYWGLHEASGTRFDATGHGYNLTDNNTVTGNPGIVENASQFTAANSEYLSLADNADISGGDKYIHHICWVYPDTVAAGAMAFAAKVSGTTYEFEFYKSGSAVGIYVEPGGVSASISSALSASVWHMVEWYHDPNDNTIAVAVNCGGYTAAAISGGINNTAGAMWLGGNPYTPGTEYYTGRICEYGVWVDRRLTLQERVWLYNNGRGRTYPFDGRYSPIVTPRSHGVLKRRNRIVGVT